MCHLVLLLPVVGVGVFWLWPPAVAVPVYVLILAVSLAVYQAVLEAMRRPAMTGSEGLRHQIGQIVERADEGWFVRVHGELWQATSPDVLQPQDRVEVTEVEGLRLHVRLAAGAGQAAATRR